MYHGGFCKRIPLWHLVVDLDEYAEMLSVLAQVFLEGS